MTIRVNFSVFKRSRSIFDLLVRCFQICLFLERMPINAIERVLPCSGIGLLKEERRINCICQWHVQLHSVGAV